MKNNNEKIIYYIAKMSNYVKIKSTLPQVLFIQYIDTCKSVAINFLRRSIYYEFDK